MAAEYKEINDDKLQKLHEVELEILNKIDEICKKYNLSFQLSGGTLLGAVRHKGFIPWDDDIDLTMVREDYDKFIQVAPKELGNEYFLQCYDTDDCYFPFIKIRKNNTIFNENLIAHLDCHKGIFVDIFPFERIDNPHSIILKLRAMMVKNIWDVILLKKKIHKSRRDMRHPIFDSMLSILPYNVLKRWQVSLMKGANKKNGKYLCALCGGYNYTKDIHEYAQMMPTSLVTFEGKEFPTYNNPDHYLTHLYGINYMELPPLEKRVNHAPKEIIFDTGDNEK